MKTKVRPKALDESYKEDSYFGRIKPHTKEKLDYLEKYIEAFVLATRSLNKRYYIDAFAGTGKNILCRETCESTGGESCSKCSRGSEVDGSALLALKAKSEFDGYTLIELNPSNIKSLKYAVNKEIAPNRIKKVIFENGNANDLISKYVNPANKYTGYLIFLDPRGSENFGGKLLNF